MTESELINFGVLNGWLKSIARVNDKTNNGHEFKIIRYPKSKSIQEFCNQTFSSIAEDIEIKQEQEIVSLLKERFYFWFYNFQPNNPLKEYFLEDKSSNFSLSDDEWKREWVEEFVDLVIVTLKPIESYTVILKRLKSYYCNLSDDIILQSDNQYFHIHCCLTD